METKLFGLINNYHIGLEDAPNMQNISDFFVYENDLYLFESNHVMQFSLKNNEKTLLSNYMQNPILIDNQLFYISVDLDLCCYDLKTGELDIISDDLVSNMTTDGEKIYYTVYHKNGIYQYDQDEKKKIINGKYELYDVADNRVYMKHENNQLVYYELNESKLIYTNLESVIEVQSLGEYVVIVREIENKNQLYIYDKEFQKETYITDV